MFGEATSAHDANRVLCSGRRTNRPSRASSTRCSAWRSNRAGVVTPAGRPSHADGAIQALELKATDPAE